jgi:hypothetical protein
MEHLSIPADDLTGKGASHPDVLCIFLEDDKKTRRAFIVEASWNLEQFEEKVKRATSCHIYSLAFYRPGADGKGMSLCSKFYEPFELYRHTPSPIFWARSRELAPFHLTPPSRMNSFKDSAVSFGLYRVLLPLLADPVLGELVAGFFKSCPPSDTERKKLSENALERANSARGPVERHFYVTFVPNDAKFANGLTDLLLSLPSGDPTLVALLQRLSVLVPSIPPKQLAAVGSRCLELIAGEATGEERFNAAPLLAGIARHKTAAVDFTRADLVERAVLRTNNWPALKDALLESAPIEVITALLPHVRDVHSDLAIRVCDLFAAVAPRIGTAEKARPLFAVALEFVRSGEPAVLRPSCALASSLLPSLDLPPDTPLLRDFLTSCATCAIPEEQGQLYSLIRSLIRRIPTAPAQVSSFLLSFIDTMTDRWSYDPGFYSHTELPGLTNLGATCYMNAVLQQLFHVRPFASTIIAPGDGVTHTELRRIFARLTLTRLPFVDTRAICEARHVDVHLQEDAGEFFTLLLESLPQSATAIFTGALVYTMKGISVNYRSVTEQPFSTLGIPVDNLSRMELSLGRFLAPERFTGASRIYTDQFGRIDVERTTLLRTLPPVLVLHLQRFKYNPLGGRKKISSEFTFEKKLDVGFLIGDGVTRLYELRGVVVHSGSAESGHYISYIRSGIRWFRCDDTCVTEAAPNVEKTDWFGGAERGPCAVLLFYADPQALDAPEPTINAAIREEIDRENAEFSRRQALFSKETLEFVSEFGDVDIRLRYFVNVVVHSCWETQAEEFVRALIKGNETRLAELIRPRAGDFAAIFHGCSLPGITKAVSVLLDSIIDIGLTDFVEDLIERLPTFTKAWRQVVPLGEFLRAFVGRVAIKGASREKWSVAILAFVNAFYKEAPSPGAKSAADFSALFDVLVALAPPVELIKLEVSPQEVMRGKHGPAFSRFMASIGRLVETNKH